MENVHAAALCSDCTDGEERRAVSENSEKIVPVALYVPPANRDLLRGEGKQLIGQYDEAISSCLDCFVACCRPDGGQFEMLW